MAYIGSVPAVTALTSASIADGAITTAKFATGAVDAAAIATNAVDSAEIVAGAVDLAHLEALLGGNATGITAGTTQSQAGGIALTNSVNVVTVVGTDADAVTLPTAAAGLKIKIYNADSAQYLRVWPATGDAIDGASANAVDVNAILFGGFREYIAYDATNWVTTSQSALYKVGTLTRDMATATGDQSITGIGFKPNHGFWLTGSNVDFQESVGITAGGLNGAGDIVFRNLHNAGDGSAVYSNVYNATSGVFASFIESAAGGSWVHGTAKLKTWDSDGFTLTWTKTGAHSGSANVSYMVSRI